MKFLLDLVNGKKIKNLNEHLQDHDNQIINIYDQIQNLAKNLDAQIQNINTQIQTIDNNLNAQIHNLSENLNAQIQTSDEQIQGINSILRKFFLRYEAISKPEQPSQPGTADIHSIVGDYSIGYSCNLLNNSYSFCKIACKNGVNASFFLDRKFADNFITSLPQWEEVDFQGDEMPGTQDELPHWEPPDFVRSAEWNMDHLNNFSLRFEYEKMQDFFKDTAVDLKHNDAFSYLSAYSVIPHYELLRLYNTVDILHVSGVHIGVASFTNKPYVTFPFGGDLFTLPFNNNEIGWMQARGFYKASGHIVSGNIFMKYIETLGIPKEKIDLIPFMIDTDIYAPCRENPLRDELRSRYPGKVLFLLGARQNWFWKGSDKLLNAIAKVKDKIENAVFLTVWYGQDLKRSEELIKTLGIEDNICKIGILSRKTLRNYIDAVDVCIDQFTHGGLGTFSLESMSCAKPLISYYTADSHFHFENDPPLLNAFSEDEISESLVYCVNNAEKLPGLGSDNRNWIKRYHGHEVLWPAYDDVYKKALMNYRNKI